jgi:hypothetical protein
MPLEKLLEQLDHSKTQVTDPSFVFKAYLDQSWLFFLQLFGSVAYILILDQRCNLGE